MLIRDPSWTELGEGWHRFNSWCHSRVNLVELNDPPVNFVPLVAKFYDVNS
jgi:hypothetical protein